MPGQSPQAGAEQFTTKTAQPVIQWGEPSQSGMRGVRQDSPIQPIGIQVHRSEFGRLDPGEPEPGKGQGGGILQRVSEV